jgi:ABC-2 type transport system permease protein
VLGFITGLWFLIGGLTFGAHIKAGIPGALVILVLVCLAASAFATLAAALAISASKASVVQGIFPLVFVILFLSTAFFPHQLLLEPASTIARLNPLSLIADGIRGPIIGDLQLSDVAKAIGGIATVMVVGIVLATWALKRRMKAG